MGTYTPTLPLPPWPLHTCSLRKAFRLFPQPTHGSQGRVKSKETRVGRDRGVAGDQVRSTPPTIPAHPQVPSPTDYHGRGICDSTEPPLLLNTLIQPKTEFWTPNHPPPLVFVKVRPNDPHHSAPPQPPPLTTSFWHGRAETKQFWLSFRFSAPNTSLLLMFLNVQPRNPHFFTQEIPPTPQYLPPLLFSMTSPKTSHHGLHLGIQLPTSSLCVHKHTSAVATVATTMPPLLMPLFIYFAFLLSFRYI